jgi:hypothetical protein
MQTSTPGRRSEGIRVAVVSAAFVIVGVLLRDQVPWYATAFFAVCLGAGLLSIRGGRREYRGHAEHLTIDDVGITRTARRLREHVAWVDITRVRIVTTDQGPQLEDVFFVVEGKNGEGCVVPHDLAVRGSLLEALQARLDGVNHAAVIEAMLSVENRLFTIWEAKG